MKKLARVVRKIESVDHETLKREMQLPRSEQRKRMRAIAEGDEHTEIL